MQIGGFQKNSLIDFPGQIAAVAFTPGCNFICPYCHNPELARGPVTQGTYDEKEILAFLAKRRGLLGGLAITGGEPTLQKDLVQFCAKVKQLGFQIKLDSNGTRPKVLSALLDQGLVDYLAMDIKTDLAHYPLVMKHRNEMAAIEESIGLVMEKAPAHEFRTTCVRPLITEETMAGIVKMIQGADLYVLQKCSKNVPVLDPEFLTDESRFFTESEMSGLKALVAPHVKEVRIR